MDEGYIQLLLYTLLQGGGKRAPVRDLIRCRWLDQSAGLAFLGCFSAAYTKRRVAARV